MKGLFGCCDSQRNLPYRITITNNKQGVPFVAPGVTFIDLLLMYYLWFVPQTVQHDSRPAGRAYARTSN